MIFPIKPYVEQPGLRVPIALIVDDPAPCINPVWYFRHQVDGQSEPKDVRTIPLDFMEQWCSFVADSGIRGDFTVLPYPAGLGRIDQGLEGCDKNEVDAWLDLAKQWIMPQFDIHCEILTHTMALDLKTLSLLPISEHQWSDQQDEATLTEYFAAAMSILKDAGLPNYGMTQPCTYTGDESLYARALLAAEKRVNGRKVTHNFVHMDSVSHRVPPRITVLEEAAGEAVVSVWCGTDDFIWNTQDREHSDRSLSPQVIADRFLTENGEGGRLPVLFRGGGPMVLVTHWQSLYSNGSRQGLEVYQETISRVKSVYGEKVQWCKISELTERFLAAQTVQFTASANIDSISITVQCPFDTDILTFSAAAPWPLFTGPQVSQDGIVLPQTIDSATLEVGHWMMRGSVVSISLPLSANRPVSVEIKTHSQ